MIFLVFVGLLSFYSASGKPLDEYYAGENAGVPNQGFFYNYRPQQRTSVYFYPNELNRPVFHPQLGMSPQYQDLVYNYVKDFAGTEPPAHVNTFQPNIVYNSPQFVPQGNVPDKIESFGDKVLEQNDQKEMTADVVTDKPGLNDYFPPSDFLSLPNHPKSQFYGHFDAIKLRRMNPKAQPTSLPPLGGVISDYVLTRGQPNRQNLLQLPGSVKENEANLQHIKRQIPDNSDGVVILAEPAQNSKMTEDNEQTKEETEENKEEQMEAHPGIAQSKPSAIALAGPGGMAQASPVGTALVGQGGLAVAAPSGTAVAGPAGQGAIPIQIGSEKQQKTTEKSEEADFY